MTAKSISEASVIFPDSEAVHLLAVSKGYDIYIDNIPKLDYHKLDLALTAIRFDISKKTIDVLPPEYKVALQTKIRDELDNIKEKIEEWIAKDTGKKKETETIEALRRQIKELGDTGTSLANQKGQLNAEVVRLTTEIEGLNRKLLQKTEEVNQLGLKQNKELSSFRKEYENEISRLNEEHKREKEQIREEALAGLELVEDVAKRAEELIKPVPTVESEGEEEEEEEGEEEGEGEKEKEIGQLRSIKYFDLISPYLTSNSKKYIKDIVLTSTKDKDRIAIIEKVEAYSSPTSLSDKVLSDAGEKIKRSKVLDLQYEILKDSTIKITSGSEDTDNPNSSENLRDISSIIYRIFNRIANVRTNEELGSLNFQTESPKTLSDIIETDIFLQRAILGLDNKSNEHSCFSFNIWKRVAKYYKDNPSLYGGENTTSNSFSKTTGG